MLSDFQNDLTAAAALHYLCQQKMFSSWRQRSSYPKITSYPQNDLLLSFLVPEKPFSVPLIDTSAWPSSTCLRQEVLLSASCPERDPWSRPQISPRWHLYWRMHPAVGQMFLAEVKGQNIFFPKSTRQKKGTMHWNLFLIVDTKLAMPASGDGLSEYFRKSHQQLWQTLKQIRTSSRNSGYQDHCYINIFLSWDK